MSEQGLEEVKDAGGRDVHWNDPGAISIYFFFSPSLLISLLV